MSRLRQKYKSLKKKYDRMHERMQSRFNGIPRREVYPVKLGMKIAIPDFAAFDASVPTPYIDDGYIDEMAASEIAKKLLESKMMLKRVGVFYVEYQLRILPPTEDERVWFNCSPTGALPWSHEGGSK